MIIFVTKHIEYYSKALNIKLYNDIKLYSIEDGYTLFKNKVKGKRYVCLDVEANGLDPYINKVIGLGIKVSDYEFVFDNTNNYPDIIKLISNKVVIGQNLKYDMKMLHSNRRVLFRKIYDTMIAEQRLYMGTKYSKGLDSLVNKYLNKVILKDTRSSFIGVNPDTFRFDINQLYYLVGDLKYLKQIRDKQVKIIKQYSMEFLLYGIEFPLIATVANAELEGVVLDKELWFKNVELEEENNFNILCKLDNIFKKLRDESNYNKGYFKSIISTGRFNSTRVKSDLYANINSKKRLVQTDLFGEESVLPTKTKVEVYKNNIKWNSPKEIQLIAGALGIKLPTEYSSEIPTLGVNTFKLLKPVTTFKLGKDRIKEYLEENKLPELHEEFLNTIIELNASNSNLSTFGRNFVEKINPITGKVHTIYRTCTANTGRFQSGGGKHEPDKFNSQNIPANINYRRPFSADKKKSKIFTGDFGGAELVLMASFAQDFKLIEISKGDMHTYMGNKMYRAIYKKRAWDLYNNVKANRLKYSKFQIEQFNKTYKEYVHNAKYYEIDKKTQRKGCKPMTFGVIYGMYGKKAEKTMNLHKGEGKVVIDAIKEEIPRTIKMVEDASAFADKHGYLIHNTRTNSRRWFPILLDANNGLLDRQSNFGIISKELSEARNSRIQGTQADFVKEGTVVLDKHMNRCILKTDDKPIILIWVHDELVISLPLNTRLKYPYIYNGKEYTNLTILIRDILVGVANRYLTNIEITVDVNVKKTWVK